MKKSKARDLWIKVRTQWFAEHPDDNFTCYICGRYLPREETFLDHKIPKSNAKNYAHRHDFSNLAPSCWQCNSEKGSKHAPSESAE